MAKLYFYFASMNAGKSTMLLQADFNYRERGMHTLLYTSGLDSRVGGGVIGSRIGLTMPARRFVAASDLFAEVADALGSAPVHCVLVDEAQFLSAAQVEQLARVCDQRRVPVLCYGLRTDFRGALFPGSARLLAIADALIEIKSVCRCGAKATMNLRVDAEGRPVREGAQTEIGGNERYVALCRKHHADALDRG